MNRDPMTWLLLAILVAIVLLLLRHDVGEVTDQPPAAPDPLVPRMDGMVHYLGFAGRMILLESPRGVTLPIDGDLWPVNDVLTLLAEVDSLG